MFKEASHQSMFDNNGFVKIQLFSNEEINSIKQIYLNYENKSNVIGKQFYTSIWSNDEQYKEAVDKSLKEELEPILSRVLNNFKAVFSNFMVKKPGENSQLPPHQDWSFVSEPEFYSITVWFPLVEVDKNNGALEILPYSNRLNNYIRARFGDSPFNNDSDYIKNNLMKSEPLKVGEALFVNSRTIHSSPPNKSNLDRIAVSIVVIPEQATLKHFILDKDDKETIIEINVTPKFFTKYSCFDYPNTENYIKKINSKKLIFNKDQIIDLIKN